MTRAAAGLAGVGRGGSSSIADVNGDGNADLLVTGSDANSGPTATLYLGDGENGFSKANAGLTGVENSSTSIADINGDGNPDLLITGNDTTGFPTTTLYMGNGQGGFSEANAALIAVRRGSSSISDVNGDGNVDLLIAGSTGGGHSEAILYLGDGNGGFSKANAGLTGVGRSSTSIGDVDKDGNPDLLITGQNASRNPTTMLYLGDGDGRFSEADTNLFGTSDGSTSIADVNGDENPDLLITGRDGNGDPTTTLFLRNDKGRFSEAAAGMTGTHHGSTSIADVNGDDKLDLLVTGSGSATLYLGNGQGGFSKAEAGLTGVQFSSSSIADVDGDGDKDLLITGVGALSVEPTTRLYVNRQYQSSPNRPPTFSRAVDFDRRLAPGLTLRRFVEAGDLDGDLLSIQLVSGSSQTSISDAGNGTAEVTFTPTRNQGGDKVRLSIEARDSDGATTSSSSSVAVSPVVAAFSTDLPEAGFSPTSIADVNNDGDPDLLINEELYFGDGQGDFAEANARFGVTAGSSSIADVNGDGNPDILLTGGTARGPMARLHLGDGNGGFSEAGADLTGVEFSSTSIADVNGDENPDLLITGEDANRNRTATLYLGDGTGGFSQANAGLTGTEGGSTSIGDFDSDGRQDLLIVGLNATTLYLGDGQGGFIEAKAGLPSAVGSASAADINDDGNLDVLISGADLGGVTKLFFGNGEGEFSQAGSNLMGMNSGSTSIADVNQDGNLDVLLTGRNASFNETAILYLGDGNGGFSKADAGLARVSLGSTSIGDIDQDGDPDLLITGRSATTRSSSTILYENLFTNPLPVELAGLSAALVEEESATGDDRGGAVRLTWRTTSEAGNAGFQIQRKADDGGGGPTGSTGPQSWESVGFVESKAESSTTAEVTTYQFTDTDLPFEADSLSYRLRQVDTNGSASFSGVVTVARSIGHVHLLPVYPNPARTHATVRFAVPGRQQVSLELYDVLGRRVRTVHSSEVERRRAETISLSGLSSGVYFLRLKAGFTVKTQRFTVVR